MYLVVVAVLGKNMTKAYGKIYATIVLVLSALVYLHANAEDLSNAVDESKLITADEIAINKAH